MSEIPDRELSFEGLAKDLSPPLARYLQRLVGNQTAAEDVLQETLIRIARGLPTFDGRSSVKTWCFTIATHAAMDYFRKTSAGSLTAEDGDAMDLPDSAPTPEEHLALAQMNACVRDVIASLSDDYRAAILLHDLGDLSARETAEACGCSEAAAKIRIHRARAKLKQALNAECAFYRDEDNVLRCHRRDNYPSQTVISPTCSRTEPERKREQRPITQGLTASALATLTSARDVECVSKAIEAIDAPVLFMQPNPKRVFAANRLALSLFEKEQDDVMGKRGGEVFGCVQSLTPEGCGEHDSCEPCKIRLAVADTFATGRVNTAVSTIIDVGSSEEHAAFAMKVSTEGIGPFALLRIDRYHKA